MKGLKPAISDFMYWLLKTEPSTYSFSQLLKDGKTNWNGVRNYQARNFLRQAKKGDLALIYHSGDDKAVVGIARIAKPAYQDPDPKGGDWVQIDLEPLAKLPKSVALKELKSQESLKGLLLIRHSRLSVMPLSQEHFEVIQKLGNSSA